jgi:endonuclease-3
MKTGARPKLEASSKKARALNKRLTRLYGRKEVSGDENPLDTLIETILSQNTTDTNSHRAFQALRRRYPRWEKLLDADPRTVASTIRSGGLADIKARRIIGALRFIKKERGRLDLEFLREMSPGDADRWLAQIEGAGPKTRGIVLLFSLRMPAFPVDTHIHRVSKRLGLIGSRVSREAAQEELARLIAPTEYFNFHINLIEHGRRICHAREPECARCVVSGLCDFFARTRESQG